MEVGTKIRMKYGFGSHPAGLQGIVVESNISLGTNVPGKYVKIKLVNDEELMIQESFVEKEQ
mgnify:CR=1 FL=1|tara:strand:- start:17014 stop:17199 length:186 start_codon:yes stop_codon:yes gene_type:complete